MAKNHCSISCGAVICLECSHHYITFISVYCCCNEDMKNRQVGRCINKGLFSFLLRKKVYLTFFSLSLMVLPHFPSWLDVCRAYKHLQSDHGVLTAFFLSLTAQGEIISKVKLWLHYLLHSLSLANLLNEPFKMLLSFLSALWLYFPLLPWGGLQIMLSDV